MRQMYTEPKIITSANLNIRSYVLFYHDGSRYREYTGKNIGLPINPNRAGTIQERNRLLKDLLYEIKKRLELGWNPKEIHEVQIPISCEDALDEIVNEKLNSSLSWSYKRDVLTP